MIIEKIKKIYFCYNSKFIAPYLLDTNNKKIKKLNFILNNTHYFSFSSLLLLKKVLEKKKNNTYMKIKNFKIKNSDKRLVDLLKKKGLFFFFLKDESFRKKKLKKKRKMLRKFYSKNKIFKDSLKHLFLKNKYSILKIFNSKTYKKLLKVYENKNLFFNVRKVKEFRNLISIEKLKNKRLRYHKTLSNKRNFKKSLSENFFSFYKILNFSITDLVHNNFFLGNLLTKSHFFYNNFFLGFRLNFLVFNLEYSIFLLKKSLNFIIDSFFTLSFENVSLMFSSNFVLSKFFQKLFLLEKQSFFSGKWFNGFLTNFKEVTENLNRSFVDLKKRKNKKLYKKFKGLHKNIRLPFFVLFSELNKTILFEINKMEIPCIGLIDSNDICKGIAYTIPCNSNSLFSKKLFFYLYKRCIFFYKLFFYIRLFSKNIFFISKVVFSKFQKNLINKKSKLNSMLYNYKFKRDSNLKKVIKKNILRYDI